MFPTSTRAAGILIIHVLILGYLLQLGAGTDEKKLDIPDIAVGRIFMQNTSSPMAKLFNSDSRMILLTDRLLWIHKQVDEAVQKLIILHRGNATRKDENIDVCNTRNTSWRDGADAFIRRHGWSLQNPSECVSDLFDFPSGTETNLRDLVVERAKIARQLAPRFAAAAAKNWSEPEFPMFHMHEEGSMKCSVDGTGGFRIRGTWYVATGYTNGEKDRVLPDHKREYIGEFHSIQEGKLVAVVMRLPIQRGVGSVHEIADNATTVVERWSGAAKPYWFTSESVSNNIALQRTVEKARDDVARIENCLRWSEIAKILLPLILNLIPVTHFTDNRRLKIIYAILSDVVTVLPLGMKGVEFVIVARKRFVSTVTRIGDVTRGEDTSIASEIWTAECGVRDDIGLIGIGFIIICIVMMGVGIGIEIGFSRKLRGSSVLERLTVVLWEMGMRWWQRMYLRVIIGLRRVMGMSRLILRPE